MVYLRKPATLYKILSFMGPTKQAKTSKLQLNLYALFVQLSY